MENIYECSYLILTNSYLLDKNMIYTDKKRLVIVYLTYPLLAFSCYYVSISIYTSRYSLETLHYILLIVLSIIVINYLPQHELYFDIDDNQRYIIISLVFLIFISKIVSIIKEYQLRDFLFKKIF